MSMSGSPPDSAIDRLRQFWRNRPIRPLRGGKLGGVSAALGLRYGIDPIIVRVVFVIATVYGGSGVLLYLLGWLLFPKEDPVLGRRSPALLLSAALIVLIFPAMFTLAYAMGLVGCVASLGCLYLLHRSVGEPQFGPATAQAASADSNTWVYPGAPESGAPRETGPVSRENPAAREDATTVSSEETTASPVPEPSPVRTQPPSWDPLATAPFAWDLPEPGEPHEPAEPEPVEWNRRWITYATLGIALIVAGGLVLDGQSLPTALAASLGVLGAGMVIGSFIRGGRGLIGVAIPLGAAVMVFSVLPFEGPWRGMGTISETPQVVEAVKPWYELSLGDITLDMTTLRFADDGPVHSTVRVAAGSVIVHVPNNADVFVRCSAGLGDLHCLQGKREGQRVAQSVEDLGPDGPGGGRIELDLKVSTGSVEVIRG